MAKHMTCSNCGRDATVESVSRTVSKVAFCERHQPTNAVTSPSYRFISKGQAKTEDVELPESEAQEEEAEATTMPAFEAEPKSKGKRKSSKASTASKESDTSEDTGESAEGLGEAHSAF